MLWAWARRRLVEPGRGSEAGMGRRMEMSSGVGAGHDVQDEPIGRIAGVGIASPGVEGQPSMRRVGGPQC